MSVTCYVLCEHNEDDICMASPTIGQDGRCENLAPIITDEERVEVEAAERAEAQGRGRA